MDSDAPTVSLDILSRAENLTLVRGMLGGVGELLAMDPELLDDVKTAVSEACNNVVLHAYPEEPGPLSVNLYVDRDELGVSVRDQGEGLVYAGPSDDRLAGIGMPVIQALASETDFRHHAEGGTEVWMSFAGHRAGRPLFNDLLVPSPRDGWTDGLSGDALVSLSPVALLGGVLGRLARALAASARFSLDRFSDVYLVTDAIAALAQRGAAASRIGFCLHGASRRVEMMVGPYTAGTNELLRGDDPVVGSRSPLALLTDELWMQPERDGGERLHLAMSDSRR
jgi:serine/threonine-protein kinase RsbW